MWSLPRAPESFGRAVGFILNDWQLAGVLTAGSAPAYDLGFSYQNNGANVNLTGSHNYGARILYVGDPGKGCSDNQYAQFNVASVTGPQPGSVGLESGRNILRGCPDKRVDLSLSRDIRLGGARRMEFRVDVFNAFNAVVIDQRNTHGDVREPDEPHGGEQPVQRRRHAQRGASEAEQLRVRRGDARSWRCATCRRSSASSSKGAARAADPKSGWGVPCPLFYCSWGPSPTRSRSGARTLAIFARATGAFCILRT